MAKQPGRTTEELFSVNGVDLNTYAKNIESITGRMQTAGRRTANLTIGGRHGTLRTKGKKLDELLLALPMWVVGSEDDGSIPVETTGRKLLFRNIAALTHLFQGRDEELDIRWVQPSGEVYQCFGDVLDTIDFTVNSADPMGKFGVTIVVSEGMWRDLNTVTDTVLIPSTPATFLATLPSFRGATAPMEDLTFVLKGPWNGPKLEFDDGSFLQMAVNIPSGSLLTINASDWTITANFAVTGLYEKLTYSTNSVHWAAMPPTGVGASPVIKCTGASRTSTTSLAVTGRRKYLVG